jgi:hypothetical protein
MKPRNSTENLRERMEDLDDTEDLDKKKGPHLKKD